MIDFAVFTEWQELYDQAYADQPYSLGYDSLRRACDQADERFITRYWSNPQWRQQLVTENVMGYAQAA